MPSYRLTSHAEEEAERRNITLEQIAAVMNAPQQILEAHSGRYTYQSQVEMDGKVYIIRVIVEATDPLTIVTVYRTSNLNKYWSNEP